MSKLFNPNIKHKIRDVKINLLSGDGAMPERPTGKTGIIFWQ